MQVERVCEVASQPKALKKGGIFVCFMFALRSCILEVMKTTRADFELFKKYCVEYYDKLGLREWTVYYKHARTNDAYASSAWLLSGMIATITLCTDWDTLRPKNEAELRKLALHEIMHILMSPLVAEAEDRYANETAIRIAEHSIIRRLENILS